YLEKMLGRNIRYNIWRTAMIAADEEKWIESQLRDSTDADLSVVKLRALPIALQRRALLKWLRTQNVADVGFDAIERVRSLADRLFAHRRSAHRAFQLAVRETSRREIRAAHRRHRYEAQHRGSDGRHLQRIGMAWSELG